MGTLRLFTVQLGQNAWMSPRVITGLTGRRLFRVHALPGSAPTIHTTEDRANRSCLCLPTADKQPPSTKPPLHWNYSEYSLCALDQGFLYEIAVVLDTSSTGSPACHARSTASRSTERQEASSRDFRYRTVPSTVQSDTIQAKCFRNEVTHDSVVGAPSVLEGQGPQLY